MNLREYVKKHNINKKLVVLTDNVKNVYSLFDRYALEGINVVNIDVKRPLDLAIDIINKYNAKNNILEPVMIINQNIGSIFIEKIIRDTKNGITFCPIESLCRATCREILDNINLIRLNKTTKAFDDSKDVKIKELKKIIDIYEKELDNQKLYDEAKIYQKATKIIKEEKVKTDDVDYIKCNFKEKENYVAKTFLDECFDNNIEVMTKEEDNTLPKIKFKKSYGLFTEVYEVLKNISENSIRCGDVEIMYTSDNYIPYIKSIFGENKIKTNFVAGYNAYSNNFVKLVRDILCFIKNNYIYEELKVVCFNKLINIEHIQNLYLDGIQKGLNFHIEQFEHFINKVDKINDDKDELYKYKESYIEFLRDLVEVYKKSTSALDIYENIIGIAKKYTYDNYDKNEGIILLNTIKETLKYIDDVTSKEDLIEVILEEMSNIKICDKESMDAITIDKFSGYKIINRKYIYILGLSSEHYKIKTTESPILSDNERKEYFDIEKSFVLLKQDAPLYSKNELFNTIDSFSNDANVSISMSNFDILNHMELAPSTFYTELLRKSKVKEEEPINEYPHIIKNDYKFDKNRFFKEKFEEIEDNNVENDKLDTEGYIDKNKDVIEKYFSKSSLETFASCPVKYHYEKEAKIQKEEYVSPNDGEWLNVAEQGNLVHRILQLYANSSLVGKDVKNKIDEKEFENAYIKAKEEMLEVHPVDSENMAKIILDKCKNKSKEYLLRLHKELSNKNNKWIVHSTEEKFGGDNLIKDYKINDKTFRIHYNGFIDRADVYEENGKKHVRLIDYKTGTMKKDKYDISMQQDIYAMYYKSLGYIVDEFVYEFVFDDAEESAHKLVYNDDVLGDPVEKNNLAQKFYDVFIDGKYIDENLKYDESSDKCKYCNYQDICFVKMRNQ